MQTERGSTKSDSEFYVTENQIFLSSLVFQSILLEDEPISNHENFHIVYHSIDHIMPPPENLHLKIHVVIVKLFFGLIWVPRISTSFYLCIEHKIKNKIKSIWVLYVKICRILPPLQFTKHFSSPFHKYA